MFRNLRKLTIPNNFIQKFNSVHTSIVSHGKLTATTERNGIREIVLNDPKTRNSLSMAMMIDLLEDINKDSNSESLRAIVISSTGPVFSAGHNLKELAGEKLAERQREVFEKCTEVVLSIHTSPVPVIAKVDGLAAAAGCQLVASCDMVVCSDRSSFSTPGANFGIFCSTPGIAVGRVIPRMKSSYMLFTGLPIDAQEAYIAGLVSKTASVEKLDEEVHKICDAIVHKSRSVIKMGKEFYYKQLEMGLRDAYGEGSDVMTKNLSSNDGKEGMESFVQKRKPKWNHQ